MTVPSLIDRVRWVAVVVPLGAPAIVTPFFSVHASGAARRMLHPLASRARASLDARIADQVRHGSSADLIMPLRLISATMVP